MIATEYAYIVERQGVPYIKGSRYKVLDIALAYLAYGWSPYEIHSQHPDLNKAQIHSAMAYYYDHQEEMDRQIEEEEQEIEKKRTVSPQITKSSLLARGKR